MNRNEMIDAINIICNYLDELMKNKTEFISLGIPLPIESITSYEVESINKWENRIAICIKFNCEGTWYYSNSKFYFISNGILENGENITRNITRSLF